MPARYSVAGDSVLPAPNFSRFSVALAISVVFHSFLLLVSFKFPDLNLLKDMPTSLQVVLVNAKSATKPVQADALAQANLDGGGNTELDRHAKSNMPVIRNMPADAELELASQRVKELEEQAKLMLAQIQITDNLVDSTIDLVERPVEQEAPNLPKAPNDKMAVARLEAQIAKEWDAYQKLPKRKFVGARTQMVAYAEYVDEWRQRIERVGTENFPEEARAQNLFGSVLVTVAIRADGTVEKVEIDRSSGSRVLDRAAKRVVQMASPFKPFPGKIRRETDILHITRNWIFTRSDLLVTD
ncbi:MAG: energy transducer TonB [Betaproteobacteria bacterium]|nr:energy transducer TonB [Betaproteobacteria bacterium]